jgi:mRNA interferase RelE/StbE
MRYGVTWTIEFERAAAKEFSSLDAQANRRIRNFFKQRILTADHPRNLGKPLRGKQSNLWRYRIGSYRVVADLRDHRLVILIVPVGHRAAVYKN